MADVTSDVLGRGLHGSMRLYAFARLRNDMRMVDRRKMRERKEMLISSKSQHVHKERRYDPIAAGK